MTTSDPLSLTSRPHSVDSNSRDGCGTQHPDGRAAAACYVAHVILGYYLVRPSGLLFSTASMLTFPMPRLMPSDATFTLFDIGLLPLGSTYEGFTHAAVLEIQSATSAFKVNNSILGVPRDAPIARTEAARSPTSPWASATSLSPLASPFTSRPSGTPTRAPPH